MSQVQSAHEIQNGTNPNGTIQMLRRSMVQIPRMFKWNQIYKFHEYLLDQWTFDYGAAGNRCGDTNAISITTSTDTQGVYDKIKDFLTQYNALINEMTSLYNADSAKGYEPLTDEEKECAFRHRGGKKWEQKIKDSLLRRDESL